MYDKPRQRYKNKTVYILGAGFSFAAGAPLLSDFIPTAFEILKRKTGYVALLKKFISLITEYSQVGMRVNNIDLDNLENIFCMVDLPLKDQKQHNEERNVLVKVITKTIHNSICYGCNGKKGRGHKNCWVPQGCMFHCRKEKQGEKKYPQTYLCKHKEKSSHYGVCIYDAFFSYLLNQQNKKEDTPPDAIITFNYDLILERFIEQNGGKFKVYYGSISNKFPKKTTFKYIERKPVKKDRLHYIKLHGSFNWRCKKNTYTKIDDIKNTIDKPKQIPLIPPTWKRGSDQKDIFSIMAGDAAYHLQTAGKIIFIGYSMPATDVYFKYLFAKSLCTPELPEIEVWDVIKEKDFKERWEKAFGNVGILGKRVKYKIGGLYGFVLSHQEKRINND